jgi:predicted ATPase
MDQALTAARSTGHPLMILFTLFFAAFVRQLRGEPREVLTITAEGLPLVDQYGYPHLCAWLGMMHGWATARTGDAPSGERRIRESLGLAEGIGLALLRPQALAMLAESIAAQGRLDDALAVLEDARATAERTEERYYSAEIDRLIGEYRRQCGTPAADVEQSLRQAVSTARSQDARGFELRAAASLARHLASAGRPDEARAELTPVLEWFTEGFDAPDYISASGFLNALPR